MPLLISWGILPRERNEASLLKLCSKFEVRLDDLTVPFQPKCAFLLPSYKSTFGKGKKKTTLCTHLDALWLVGKCDKMGSTILGVS